MKTKSLQLNMVLNIVRGMMNVIFPLITYPYVSRILGVEQLGRLDFSQSIINYIVLIAGLGFANYIIREGSPLRDNRKDISKLSSEIFTLNMISSFLAYAIMLGWIMISSKLQGYWELILILSINVILKTIGVEWVFTIYEDYLYITIRSILFQVLSLVALFAFVRERDDLYIYAMIVVFAGAGSFIFNFFRARKFLDIRIIFTKRMIKYMSPVLVFFAMSAFQTIYISCDTTILGYISGDYYVGLYGVSTKIYMIIKSFLSSAVVVALPRLCKSAQEDDSDGFKSTANEVLKSLLFLVIPAIIGILFYHKEMILIISTKEFLGASKSLVILSFSLFSSLLAYFWAHCVLISYKKENLVLVISIISASLNIIFNIILIPFFQHNAAAFTTVMSESFIALMCYLFGRKYLKLDGLFGQLMKILAGCIFIIAICFVTITKIENGIISFIIGASASVIVYILVEIALKNEVVYPSWIKLKSKLKK